MLRRYAHTLLFVVCALLLLLMVWQSDPALLWQNLIQIRWGIVLCLLTWAVVYVLNSYSWATIISSYEFRPEVAGSQGRLTAWRVFKLTVTGYALNYVTPFGLLGGEPYRVVELKKYIGVEAATSSVTLYAMMHVCSHFLFWIIGSVTAAFVIADISSSLMLLLISVSLVCLIVIFLFFKAYRRGLIVRLFRFLSRIPFLGRFIQSWSERHSDSLLQIDKGISSLLLEHPEKFCISLAVELLARLVNVVEIVFILYFLGCDASFADALLILAFSSLFANILFFSPLQMGTREGGIFLVLQLINPTLAVSVLMPMAISISFATRIREFFWIAVGILLLATNRSRNANHRNNTNRT